METTTRSKPTSDQLTAFLREVSAAVKKLGIYPTGHPASVKAAEKPFVMLDELLQNGEQLIFAVADGKLLGNGMPLEDRALQDGLGKVLCESDLSSISFHQGLAFPAFEKFLAHLNLKKEQRDLQAFVQSENIKAISIGKVQYQLVGKDERVVSADMAESLGDGSREIQTTIAETLREHPTLLLQLLAKGQGEKQQGSNSIGRAGEQVGFGGSSALTINGGATAPVRIPSGTGTGPTPCRELEAFSDEELLRLVVAALRENLGNQRLANRFEMGRTLFALKDILAEREAIDLLPKLRQSLVDLDMVDPKYLELIFASDSSPRKVAHVEIQRFKNDFAGGSISPYYVEELLGWLMAINTDQYTEDIIKALYSETGTQSYNITEGQRLTLLRLASLSAEEPDTIVARTQLSQIRELLSDPSLSSAAFTILSDQLEVYYLKFLEQDRYASANQLLELICQKCDTKIIYAEGVTECASKVHQRLTSPKIAETLITKLRNNFEGQSRAMALLLENFNGIEPISVFTSHIGHENRGIRLLLLRLLSGFGLQTIEAFRLLLSDRTLTARPTGHTDLSQESWFKVRNIIFVLSNIKHPDSVALVKQFADDRDTRVVLEAVNALERLGGDEAANICSKLLSHPSREVQLKALHNLVANGSPIHYPAVEEYFVRSGEERAISMPALIKLDRQRALSFLAAVLLGEAETYNKYCGKPDEELNETVVSTFIQLRSVIFDDVLRKYVRVHTRSLLGHLRKPNSVRIAERYLKTTSSGL
ncbi:MAG: HEAT repeat domain-containing protein [Candidatus Zixiibacteriota bacterium]|nr:MAG: HEAT repeat domain-containing protein [candidate division Zixibacteria bacterium]